MVTFFKREVLSTEDLLLARQLRLCIFYFNIFVFVVIFSLRVKAYNCLLLSSNLSLVVQEELEDSWKRKHDDDRGTMSDD